jgi:hypothetical protein
MECRDDRAQLIDFFDTSFRFVSKERGIVLSEFIKAVADCVSRMEEYRTSDLESVNTILRTENNVLKDTIISGDSRSDELTTVNAKQLEGINAFRGRVCTLKQRIAVLNGEIVRVKENLASTESSLIAANELCADIRAANVLLDERLMGAVSESRSSTVVKNLKSALRKLGECRKDLFKLKRILNTWSKRSGGVVNGRCGCSKSIRYFVSTGIDLEWFHTQAVQASENFQKELKETASSFREQVLIVRKERDDALADNELYIGQLISMREETNHFRVSNESISREMCYIKQELTVCRSIERVVRHQLLIGADGREKVCPVPTMDGMLISLVDVYKGWMSGMGEEGVRFQFECPASGALF